MENTYRRLPHVAVHLDDTLVTGGDEADHLKHLKPVLKRLNESDLRLRLEKYAFIVPRVEYL